MTTVVNTPAPVAPANTGGNAFFVGVVLLVGLISALLYFGIPALRRMGPIQVNIPSMQVNTPDKVNVNVTPAK